jgi:outer membrane protein assembly factor BamB
MLDWVFQFNPQLAVVPILIGPLQVLILLLPALLLAVGRSLLKLFKPSTLLVGFKVLWRNKIAVVGAALVVAGLGYLGAHAANYLQPRGGKADRRQANWPMFRGGPARTGKAIAADRDPAAPANVWAFTRDTRTFYASPAVLGNLLFVSSVQGIGPFNVTGNGAIYCLDANSGAVIWKYAGKNFRATFSSPSVSGEYLVCGEGLHLLTDARITCLRLKEQNGTPSYEFLWEQRTRSHVESSACIFDGSACIGAGDDGLYCLALEPGKDGRPAIKWHLPGTKDDPASKYADCEASPAAANGKVCFGLGLGGKAVVCVDAASGAEIWRQPAPYPVFGDPAIVDGKVFIGMGNGNFVQTAIQVRALELEKLRERKASPEEIEKAAKELAPGGAIWCLDLDKGNILWQQKLPDCVLGAVAVSDGRLYFGDRGGLVMSLTTDGKSPREKNLHEPIIGSPAAGSNCVYFVTGQGNLFCLDKQTLEIVWRMSVGQSPQGMAVSSPALGNGHLYVGSEDNGLLCVGEPVASKKADLWAGNLGGPAKGGWADRSAVPNLLRFAWGYPQAADDGEAGSAALELAAPPACQGDALYLQKRGPQPGLVKLVLTDDTKQPFREGWIRPTTNSPNGALAIGSNAVFLVDGKPGDANRRLLALDSGNGSELASRPISLWATGKLLLTEDSLLVFDDANRLACFDPRGTRPALAHPLWSCAVSNPVGAPALAGDIVLAAQSAPAGIIAMCRFTGRVLWQAPLPAAPCTGPVVREDRLAVGTAQGLAAMSIRDGAILWTNACGATVDPLAGDQASLVSLGSDGTVRVYDWDGRELAAKEGAVAGITPMLCGDCVVILGQQGVVDKLEIATGQTSRLADGLDWLGDPTTAAILLKSQFYYGTKDRGLVCLKAK